ncbi:hypothetical protein [Oceanibaculum nanhaiense]|uniref:hypothetical protein n=1 Tax=Oceanibaculum nanhaiense TaxID=1909734 RepID=UPI003D2AD476
MAFHTAAGTRLYIGTTLDVDFEAQTDEQIATAIDGDSLVEVGELETMSPFGDTAAESPFTALGDRRVRKAKGSFNAGNLAGTCAFDSGDAGQAAILAALATDFDYNFKVVFNDGSPGSPSSPTTQYFRGKVMGAPVNVGNADNVIRRDITVGINSKIVQIDAV